MTQNDKRNAKISEVCRVLANACMSENTSLYPEDIMTFINESRNSDVRELLALHIMLNEIDATRRLEKNIECAEAWRSFRIKRRYARLHQKQRAKYYNIYNFCVEETWEKRWQDYDKAEAQLKLEEENTKRRLCLSNIACNAVKEVVKYATIVRFMQTVCKDDDERTFFLAEYAQAEWRDGCSGIKFTEL